MVTIDLVLKKLKLSEIKIIRDSGMTYAAAVRNEDLVDLHNSRVINIVTGKELQKMGNTISGALFVVGDDVPDNIYSNIDMIVVLEHNVTVEWLVHEINRIIADYEKYCIYAGRLYMISNDDADWSKIFELFAEYYDNLVCFGDSSGNVIFSANTSEDAEKNDETIRLWRKYGYVPKEYARDNGNIASLEKVFQSEIPLVLNKDFAGNHRRLVYRSCKDNGVYNHYFSVVETKSKYGYFDRNFLTDVGDLVTSLYARHRLHEIEKPRNALFRDLASGLIKDEEVLKNRMDNCYLPLKEYYQVIYLGVTNGTDSSMTEVERMHLKNTLDNDSPPLINYRNNEYIAILLVGKNRELIESTKQKLLNGYLKNEKLLIGISSIYSDLLKTQIKLREAELSATTGYLLYPTRYTHCFEDLYIDILIKFARERTDTNIFIMDELIKLKAYDKQRNTEYYDTLYAFILCKGSINRLCEKLTIHKNTALYRVNKIKEIIELELSDFNELVRLYLSFLVLQWENENVTK